MKYNIRINKLHVPPEICSKYDDSCSAACRQCQKQPGTLHLMWPCPLIKIVCSTFQTEYWILNGVFLVLALYPCLGKLFIYYVV